MKINFINSSITPFKEENNLYHLTSPSLNGYFPRSHSKNAKELISTDPALDKNHKFVLTKYEQYKPTLIEILNKIHKKSFSNSFWEKSFCLYIPRIISSLWIRFNKFSTFNTNEYYTRTLSVESYQYANDTAHSMKLFMSSDLYQDQMFSIYLNTFFQKENFEEYNVQHKVSNDNNPKSFDFSKIALNKVNIISTHLSPNVKKCLSKDIKHFYLPDIDLSYIPLDFEKRNKLEFSTKDFKDKFDEYFFNALKYVLPKSYVEGFDLICNEYNKVKLNDTKYILCENWICSDKLSIFLAIMKDKNIQHYALEHAHAHYYKSMLPLILSRVSDKYISFGWKNNSIKNLIRTGVWRIDCNKSYKKINPRKKILYASYGSMHKYDVEFITHYPWNESAQLTYFKSIKKLMSNLRNKTKHQIVFKSYPQYFNTWHNYHTYKRLFKYGKNFNTSNELFYGNDEFLRNYKLIVTGSFSTVFSESLLHDIPTISFYNKNHSFIKNNYSNMFFQLEKAGILHSCPYKMAKFIEKIENNPNQWWNNPYTKYVRKKFKKFSTLDSHHFLKLLSDLEYKG